MILGRLGNQIISDNQWNQKLVSYCQINEGII